MKTYTVLNITHDYKLYNFFDRCKELLAFKDGVSLHNLYNGDSCDIVTKRNDFFYKNDTPQQYLDKSVFNPVHYSVQNTPEMFKKFYYFIKNNYDALMKFDYIIRCNSSTFLNFKVIQNTVNNLPSGNCYAGTILNRELVSGTCIYFSKDVINVIANTDIEDFKCDGALDDVVLGNFVCKAKSIQPTSVEQYSFTNCYIPDNNEIAQALKYPSVRVRNNTDRLAIDVEIWRNLFEHYTHL